MENTNNKKNFFLKILDYFKDLMKGENNDIDKIKKEKVENS